MHRPIASRRHHYLPIMFALILLVPLVFAFVSFPTGAYLVFNKPVSNVVAVTVRSGNQLSLEVRANSLQGGASRLVWLDPEVVSGINGTLSLVQGTGYNVGGNTTDSSGNLVANFVLSNQTALNSVLSDGRSQHLVWVLGLGNKSTNALQTTYSLTSDSEVNYTSSTVVPGVALFVMLITVPLQLPLTLGQIFLALFTIYIIMFAMTLNGPFRSILGAMKESFRSGTGAIFDNSAFAWIAVFPIVLWAEVALSLIQSAGGISTGSLAPTDGLLLYVSLALAPLREELGFRVIPIGVAAAVILFSRGRLKDGLLSLWHPSRYLKRNDTPKQYSFDLKVIYLMVAISAAVFGLAHFLSGAGWGPGKIIDAAEGGLAFAILYYKYGFPAAVLCHWAIDYFIVTYTLLPNLEYYDVLTSWSLLVAIVSSAALLYLFFTRKRRTLGVGTVFPSTTIAPTQSQ